jgi:alpha-tubulin suppressor-like RCC1 family protein
MALAQTLPSYDPVAGAYFWSSPVQVGSASTWSSVSSGFYHGLGVQTDGTLWAWGYGDYGQLGNGQSGGQYPSPIQIGSNTNWEAVGAGEGTSMATKTDGTLWTWGQTPRGQGGRNNAVDVSSPVAVGNATNWTTPKFSGNSNFLGGIPGALRA